MPRGAQLHLEDVIENLRLEERIPIEGDVEKKPTARRAE
jgi:hypothetical protein